MNTYTGAPDECNVHWPHKLNDDSSCTLCTHEQEVEEVRFQAFAQVLQSLPSWQEQIRRLREFGAETRRPIPKN